MGRPKLSDLSCTICNEKFKKKSFLDDHMENHLSSRQSRKHLKNYCYVCKKSFDPDKYKIHIQIEHQFDLHKMDNDNADDLFSCENGFVLLSKRKIKKGMGSPEQKLSAVEKNKSLSVTDIKIEPTDMIKEESDLDDHQNTESQKSKQKNILKVKMLKQKCSICGMVCKGRKGLKIHMSAHKRSQCKSYDASPNENNEDSNEDVNSSQLHNQSNNFNKKGKISNSLLNVRNANSSIMNSTNQSNAQLLQSTSSLMNEIPDDIPKFDCNSEKYMKWLKNFAYKCKMHDVPLSLELCDKVSHVTHELITALSNPQSSLKQKANHFYFMSMYNILSEIMLNHLQYQLCGIKK